MSQGSPRKEVGSPMGQHGKNNNQQAHRKNSPPKFKDLGCPTISCVFSNSKIEKALLDLGASVNLLPYLVYKQLGLGELKPLGASVNLLSYSVYKQLGLGEFKPTSIIL